MGKADRPKGLLKTSEQSSKVIPFFQDACYYARIGNYYNHKNKLSKALLFLQKAIEIDPDDPFNHYNLACLLSKSGRLKEANGIFRHIVQNMDAELTECYFFMAVNHGLLEDIMEAKRCLVKYLHASPDGDMAEEAEDLLLVMEEDDCEIDNCSLSPAENEALLQLIDDLNAVHFRERLIRDQEFGQLFQVGLYQGNDLVKEAIIKLFGAVDLEKTRNSLVDFVANPWVKERLRQVAVNELKRTAPERSLRIFKEGHFCEINLQQWPLPAPVWENTWQQVLECTFANMRRSAYYSADFFEDAEAIWLDYINHCYPKGPRVDNPKTWAAGLEYCLARFHFLGLTQKELAKAYGVSVASVKRKFMQINKLLQIDQKAYRNMLVFLSNKDGV